MNIIPVVLKGSFVTLQPLEIKHLDALCEVGLEPEIWSWSPSRVESREDLQQYIYTALDEQKRGLSLPFVTIENESGKIVGSTRFGNIDALNRRAEIGWTWINPRWQRTFVNTEAKLLMLTHAFEIWKCIRVELKTDALNNQSRNAILRLGAKQEGIFRQHVITDSGRLRDTVFFSILDREWRDVKKNLEEKLRRNNE